MRLDPKLVHPSLFKATDALTWSGGSGKDPKALAEHQTVWMKENGVALLGWIMGAFALFIGTLFTLKGLHVGKPAMLLSLFGLVAAFISAGVAATVRHSRRLSINELDSLLPLLQLSEAGKAYAETIVILHRSGRPALEIGETMTALNALLDEEARLIDLRERLAGDEETGLVARLVTERQSLADKAETVVDPGAREAYAQSLVLMDERIAGLHAGGAGLERIEAHLTLLRQAVFATRDAARRLGAAPSTAGPDLATDSLRSAVALARAQSQATEQALVELRSI